MSNRAHLISAALAFAATLGVAAYGSYHLGRESAYDEGYSDAERDVRREFAQARLACFDARKELGELEGQYYLVENGVTLSDVQAAEEARDKACQRFEF